MSTLLDSLRRAKQVEMADPPASDGGRRQVEAILSTLGYARHRRWKRLLRLAVGGVGVVSVVLLGWVMWGRSPSMPPGMQVATDVSTDDPGALLEGTVTAGAAWRTRSPVAGGNPVPARVDTLAAPTESLSLPGSTPTDASETAPGGMTSGTRPPAVEQVASDAPIGGPGAPAPGASESSGDAPLLPLVETGADTASAQTVPATAESPAAALVPPSPLDPPPVPMVERGPVVTEVFAAALTFQRAGNVAGAIAEYRTLLAEGVPSAQVHNNLGLLYQDQNQLDDAVREFRRAIAIDPRYSKAYNNLGVARMRQGRHQEAAAAFRDARRLDGTNLDAWVNLALTQQAGDDPVAARRTLVDALSVDAGHAPTHYNLARLFELGGDPSRAIEHYGRFVEHSGVEHAALVDLVSNRIAAAERTRTSLTKTRRESGRAGAVTRVGPHPMDPDRNKCALLAADASRPAALLVACILPVCALLAPEACRARRRSRPRRWHHYSGQGP